MMKVLGKGIASELKERKSLNSFDGIGGGAVWGV